VFCVGLVAFAWSTTFFSCGACARGQKVSKCATFVSFFSGFLPPAGHECDVVRVVTWKI